MQKRLTKLVSVVIAVLLLLTNAMPLISYAAEETIDSKTSEENVEFSASIEGLTEVKTDLASTLNLNLSIKVSNTGYLKDASVTLSNNNYVVSSIVDEKIKEVEGSTIVFNQINAGDEVNVNLPISLPKDEKIATFLFDNTSTLTLKATYVNEKGKEKSITKNVEQKLTWTKDDAKEQITQKLVRYLKYDETKTMLTFEVSDGIVDNTIPVLSKEISIVVPQLNKTTPSKVIFTEEGYESEYKDGILTIKYENKEDSDGNINWNSDSSFLVTYIYDVQTNEKDVQTEATAKVDTVAKTSIKASTEVNTYSIEQQVGSIVELNTSSVESLSKGYMYTNSDKEEGKLETSYTEKYEIDLGSSELTDKVTIDESESAFVNESGNVVVEATNMIETKSVSIEKDNLTKVLGEDGYIIVLDTESKEIARLTKDNLNANLQNMTTIKLETSKPQAEGAIELSLEKAIKGEANLTKEQIQSSQMLASNVNIKGIKSDVEISNKTAQNVIKLTEPETTVSLTTSTDTLSTVVENKDVVFNIVLNTKNIENRLFENPTLTLTLPSEVKNINVTDAKVLYDDELTAGTINVEGQKIALTLNGKQTKYSESALTEGTLVRVTADITLDDLAPSNKEAVTLEYTNVADNSQGTVSKEIEIVAPTGFVTANTVTEGNKSVTAVEGEVENIEVADHSSSKEMDVTGTIVNNLGEDATGVTVLGVFPYEGNKTVTGEDLGTSVTTSLTKAISTEGLDNAVVYYSEDENATVDSNTWSTTATSAAKAYKITSSSALANGEKATFSYSVELPQNLDYAETANQTYGVYYDNNSEEGTTQNLVLATKAGASTPNVPQITMTVSAVDTNEGYAISEGANVTEGEEITYRVKISNTGSEAAKNVKVTMTLPDGLSFIDHKYINDAYFPQDTYEVSDDTERTTNIAEIAANTSTTIEFNTVIGIALQNDTLTASYSLNADNVTGASKATFETKVTKGTLKAKLTANKSNSIVENGDEVTLTFNITNLQETEQNNVTITFKLPQGVEYVDKETLLNELKELYGESIANETLSYQANYDSNNNTVTVNVGTIKAYGSYSSRIKIKISSEKTENLKISAKVKSDENSAEVTSNTMTFNGVEGTSGVEVTHTTSLGTNTAVDTDTFNMYIDITNNGGKDETLKLKDNIPYGLTVKSYQLTVDGVEKSKGSSNYISETFTLAAGKSARLSISVKPNTLYENETMTYEVSPSLTTLDGEEITINTLSIKVNGTGEAENPTSSTYTIAGIVFEDSNNNGKMDDDEKRFNNIIVMLFNASTLQIASDSNGNEYKATTGSEGDYRFSNLSSGNYIVVAQFDNKEYGVGLYKVSGIDESENIDFISSTLNNEEVAATDTIKLQQNEYNINLGLVSKNTFDLSINKAITKITVANSKNGTKVYNYDNEKTAKVELSTKNVESNTILIEYKISITNEGKVEGYADSIIDYIPEGLSFNADLNSTWYLKDGNAYNQSLANTIIKPGETKDLTLVLSKKMTGEDTGTFNNIVEIASSYNEYSIKDIDSTARNKKDGEDDLSTAVAIILMSTGREAISVAGLTIGILALVGFAVFEIKKHVISNKI